jgi:glycosyltransferase involved in cell wall biosynthesis
MENKSELINNLKRIKISIIMQVNLQNYPGSRENAINKFIRSVKSFQEQTYKNSELIIVADDDTKVHQIYNKYFSKNNDIKFIFFDRPETPKMYTDLDEGTYYRGLARQIGRSIATGDIVTYMDSDDLLMPDFTITHMLVYNSDPSKDFWLNRSWIDNDKGETAEENILEPYNSEKLRFDNLGSTWKAVKVKKGKTIASPWLLSHKLAVTTKWRDVISDIVSEDMDFVMRLAKEYKNGGSIERPIYIRCHYKDLWDY